MVTETIKNQIREVNAGEGSQGQRALEPWSAENTMEILLFLFPCEGSALHQRKSLNLTIGLILSVFISSILMSYHQ